MEILDILPQKLVKFSYPDLEELKVYEKEFSNLEYIDNSSNMRSVSDTVLRMDSFTKLNNWILDCLEEVRVEFNYHCTSLAITQSWTNKTKKDSFHHPHVHPNSILSGIMYFNNSNASTLFGIPNMWYFANEMQNQSIKISWNGPDSVVDHAQEAIAGDLIIFPSHLKHSTLPHNIEDYDRISLSFNIFPSGSIGDFGALSGLNIIVE